MDVLEKMFGSAAKVKIMRLFLFNSNTPFGIEQIVEKAKITPQAARLNLRILEAVKLIKPKSFMGNVRIKEDKKPLKKTGGKKGKNQKAKKLIKVKNAPKGFVKKRIRGWILNDTFSYLTPLQSFLVQASPLQDQNIIRKFNRAGKIKLLIISGTFIQERDSRVDILVVGDGIRRATVDATIKDMEAELGKDLAYAVFETTDFQYRLGMYDKLIRDILDYPHKKLINKLAL